MAPCVAHDGALRRHAGHSQRRHAGHCDACMRHAGHLPAARSGVRCPPPLRCMPPLCPHRVLSLRILCARVLSRRAQVKCATGSVNQIPSWVEIRGNVRLTPFYEIVDVRAMFGRHTRYARATADLSATECDRVDRVADFLVSSESLVARWSGTARYGPQDQCSPQRGCRA